MSQYPLRDLRTMAAIKPLRLSPDGHRADDVLLHDSLEAQLGRSRNLQILAKVWQQPLTVTKDFDFILSDDI